MGDPRILLADHLRLQSPEIAQAILDRLRAMEDENAVRDIEYLRGLEAAVSSGVEFGLELITLGDSQASVLPLPVLTQARLAARHRIPLKLVLRRYLAAKTVLQDFVLRTAADLPGIRPTALHKTVAAHNASFDQLVAAVSEEYEQEMSARRTTRNAQQVDLIHRLLRGEPADGRPLGYPFDGYHLGLVVLSDEPQPLLRSLAREVDARLLTTRPSESVTWAWLGKTEAPDLMVVSKWADANWPSSVPLGLGEVARSLSGWRRTHDQARAAASLNDLSPKGLTRYRDIALHSAACRDPLLLASMREMYLVPLAQEKDRGEVLRETLRAFFAADRNSSSAASALGVSRQTVSKRLQLAEQRIEQPVAACGDLLQAALQLEECGTFSSVDNR
jgi:hypothetical protein